ncbi:uncharacterized protein LOC125240293 isoform X1 [Leguminivora glycinivorella]|uniref:uncharacterized protein LOC125240293 isoform X1 n=1 Tax=Leguminivora glycinivorella TaxID=1035111 RepID=UPI00200E0DA9|nr:uncharacterized protein LOC125240293 isoform X1 [Leguminivora glycinivorella]
MLEKWYDGVEKRDLLRVRFVYQSTEQIRDGVEASLLNPPLEALLELEGCAVDTSSGRRQSSDDDRKPGVDDDMCSEGSAPATEGKLSTEELLAEAAMRSALAAEKQAEAVAQGVELLRDLVAILRERPLAAPSLPPEHLMHHHHRL